MGSSEIGKMKTMDIECPHCGKFFKKRGIKAHIWRVHGDGQNFDPNMGYKMEVERHGIKDLLRKRVNKFVSKEKRFLKGIRKENTNSVVITFGRKKNISKMGEKVVL